MEINYLNFGEKVKHIRNLLALKQDQLAELLGISQNYISQIETGIRKPSDQLIKCLCYCFHLSEIWLKTGEGEMFISPEDVLKQQKARLGERAFLDAVNSIMKEHGLAMAAGRHPHRADTGDQELDNMINTIYDLWASGEDMKGWLKVQFRHAFPADVIEESQKKQQETSRQTFAG